jgi:hypothetical protein
MVVKSVVTMVAMKVFLKVAALASHLVEKLVYSRVDELAAVLVF